MDYVYYMLITIAIGALCLALARIPRQRQELQHASGGLATDASALQQSRTILQRDLRSVPTPWGWPGSQVPLHHANAKAHRAGGGGSGTGFLQRWSERLLAQKQTVDDSEYLLRKDASLRALVEDRFGRSSQPTELEYEKVQPPRLRDPDRPYDQMDNFPSGKTNQVVAGLKRQPPDTGNRKRLGRKRSLSSIKTPWGW